MQAFAIVLSFAVSAVAIVLTTIAVRRMLGVIRAGKPTEGRTGNPGSRLLTMLKETVLHTRMLQWTWVGILHWFAFAAFLFLSTAVLSAYFQLFSPEFTWPIIGKWFPYEWAAEFLGLLGTLGIIPLIVYRLTHMPAEKGRATRFFGSTMWQAFFVEAMVLLESSAILFIRGAEYDLAKAKGGSAAHHATAFHFPLAQLFGHLYPTGAAHVGTLENWVWAIAAFKIVSAMVWLIVISTNLTMGVAWHRFTAWFNIFYKRESVGRSTDGATLALGAMKPLLVNGAPVTLESIDDLDEDAVLGAGTIHDFAWKGILDFTTCTECGRCQSQCPAWNTEKPLSPKLLMMGLREQAYAAAPYLAGSSDVAAKALIGSGAATSPSQGEGVEVLDYFYNPSGADYVIDEDVLWSCTSCGACVQQCPVDIEHVDHIMDMRRYQVLVESNFPTELNGLFKGLENKGNPWNMSATARLDWAKDLPFDVRVVGQDIESLDEVDWLFWVGCAGAYEDRAKKTTRAVAELLDMAGISFGVLGNGETCTGDPARRAGNEFVFQGLAQQNVETFKEFRVKKAVTTCAHCFNTLKNEYKSQGIELEVVHHTQLLNQLVREGKLTPVTSGAGAHKRSITYHDPCYIGRHNGVYTPPRELLQVLPGAEYVEMPRNSERSFCCGAGGARMWMEERLGTRINRNRTDEAVATGADQIAVGCPFCRVMLSDGLTAAQADGTARESVEVLDVAQMLLASVKGEQATKLAPGQATQAPAARSVETKAEPEPGDVTVTPSTVTDPADVGPAAKASGGTSLFDTPESAPAEAPAPTSGGSLFDTPAPAAAEPAAPEAQPAAGGSGGSGGSLFDVAPAAPAAPAAEPSAPAEPAAAQPAGAGPAGAQPAAPAPASGGSLFDIPAAEAPSAPAPASPEAASAASAPEAAPAAPAAPEADLNAGGSLFDIPAAEAPAAASAPASAPSGEAAPAEAPAVPADASTAPADAAAPAPAPAPAAPAQPAVDLNAGGSLFDIPAPDAAPAAAAPAAAAPEAPVPAVAEADTPSASASPAEPAREPAPEPVAEPAPAPSQATAPADTPSDTSDTSDTTDTTDASTTGGVSTSAVAAPASGTASTPHTDVDIDGAGSLFDIPAPEGSVTAAPGSAPAAPRGLGNFAPVVEANEKAAAAGVEPPSAAHPAPAVEDQAQRDVAPESAASAAPDASASDAEAEPATTTPEDVAPDAAAVESETPPAAAESEAPPEAPAAAAAPAQSSGEAHTPRTDVDITGAGSLFDL